MLAEKNSVNKHEVQQVQVPVEAPKFSAGLVVRTIVALLAMVNFFASLFGFDLGLGLDAGQQQGIYVFVSGIVQVIAGLPMVWNNNNVTKKARKKQVASDQIKDPKK